MAGGDDIHVPRPSDGASEYADRLEGLIAPSMPDDGETPVPGQDPLGES